MGKAQSKSSECILISGHYNPLMMAELTDEGSRNDISEHAFTGNSQSCESIEFKKANFANDNYPLTVHIPPADDVDSVLELKKEMQRLALVDDGDGSVGNEKCFWLQTDCVDNPQSNGCCTEEGDEAKNDKQEFVFTLYDVDCQGKKVTKDEIAGVVKSIYEAISSSIKLPLDSPNKVLKLKLTICPESSNSNEDPAERTPPQNNLNDGADTKQEPHKLNNSNYKMWKHNLQQSGEKVHKKKATNNNVVRLLREAGCDCGIAKHNGVCEEEESVQSRLQKCCCLQCGNKLNGAGIYSCCDEKRATPRHSRHIHNQPINNRDNVPESKDRKNHYSDLVGIENHSPLPSAPTLHSNCPYVLLDESHNCTQGLSKGTPVRKSNRHRKSHEVNYNEVEIEDDNEELYQHHSRSKSQDYNENVNSPRLQHQKNCCGGKANQLPSYVSPHHHRHRNREREHMRAVQQVASWLTKENFYSGNVEQPDDCMNNTRLAANQTVMYEHIHHHHHYHHYTHEG